MAASSDDRVRRTASGTGSGSGSATGRGAGGSPAEGRRLLGWLVLVVVAAVATATAVAVPTPRAEAAPCWLQPVPPPTCPDPPLPPTTQPHPPPVPGDNDGDRIVDSYENSLLRRFAPRIWLHPDENRRPVNVEWLLARSRLRYGHPRCPDHGLLAYGDVTRANITEQSHRNAHDLVTFPPWDACEHYGSSKGSDWHTGDIKESFFLQFTDASHTGSARNRDWVVYGHVYPASGDRIVIQYWQLYPYNDSVGKINHEGDWEYTAVVVDRDETVQRVVFFRHGHDRDVAPSRVEWVGNHHVTFSAKGSHGQYRATVQNDECVAEDLADDVQGVFDFCARGTAWDTWTSGFGGIVNVGEKNRPLNGANWLRYSGLWGEIGFSADVVDFTSGPRGPAYQPSWNWRPPSTPPPTPPPTTTTTTTTRPTTTTTRRPTLPQCPPRLPNCQEP